MSRRRRKKREAAPRDPVAVDGPDADGHQPAPTERDRVLREAAVRTDPVTRAAPIHVYLPQCVVIGSIYTALPHVVDFLNVSGSYLHLHRIMWVPYKESGKAIVHRDGLIGKREVLFVVERGEDAAPSNATRGTARWHPVDVATGPFRIRGNVDFEAFGTLAALATCPDRFLPLRDTEIEGPHGAVFRESSVLLNLDRASLIAAD